MLVLPMPADSEHRLTYEAGHSIAHLANSVQYAAGKSGMILLPNFRGPGPNDVICARGKKAINHPGNKQFREMIRSSVEEYKQARTKLEKSLIVSSIVDAVRQSSPDGGFVKKEDGLWYEVGDHIAREKCGQSFRDILHEQYRSSTKAKMKRRKDSQESTGEGDGKVKTSGVTVSDKMQELAGRDSLHSRQDSDDRMKTLFNEANAELLQQIKRQSPELAATTQRDDNKYENQSYGLASVKDNHRIEHTSWSSSYDRAQSGFHDPKRIDNSYAYGTYTGSHQEHHHHQPSYALPVVYRSHPTHGHDGFSVQPPPSRHPTRALDGYYPSSSGYVYNPATSYHHTHDDMEEPIPPPPALEERISRSIFDSSPAQVEQSGAVKESDMYLRSYTCEDDDERKPATLGR